MSSLGRLSALLTGAVLLTALPTAAVAQKTIRLAHHHPVGSVIDITSNRFAEEVNKANKGVTVRVFPAAQLGQEQENAEGVYYGTVDASITSSGFFNKWVRGVGFEQMPFLFKDEKHVDRAMGSDAPVTKAVRTALAEKGNAHLLGFLDLGFRDFATRTKPITSPDDLKNSKMRAPEIWTWIRMYQLLGARPTPVTWGEVYTALQSGVAEGLDAPVTNLVDNKLYEVTKFVTKAAVIDTTMAFTVNKKTYDSLTPEQKALIDQAGRTALEFGNRESRALAAKGYEVLKQRGIQINELDTKPLAEAVKPMYAEFVEKNGGKEFVDLTLKLRD